MEGLIIFVVGLIVLILVVMLSRKTAKIDDKEEIVNDEPVVMPLFEANENGTVVDLKGLEKYGYGDLAINAPLVNPYSFFFFIVRYRARNGSIRFSIAISRGFEEPRIIKYCTYDEYTDLTQERIEKFVNKFDMFVDDVQFNSLVCNYRPDSIIEIIKKL